MTTPTVHVPSARKGGRLSPLAATVAITFLGFTGFNLLRPVVPLYARQVGLSVVEIGLLTLAMGFSTMFVAIPLGMFTDRFGRGKLAASGLGLSTLSSLMLIVSRDLGSLLLAHIVTGVGWAMFEPAVSAAVADASKPGRIGRAWGYYSSAIQTGTALGPAAGGAIAAVMGFSSSFLASAIIYVIAVLASLVFLGLRGSGKSRTVAADSESSKRFTSKGKVVSGWSGIFFSFFTTYAFFTYLPLYAQDAGIDVATIGLLFSIYAGASLLTRYPLGVVSDRFSKKAPLLLAGLVVISISVIIGGLSANLLALAGVMILLSVGRSACNPQSNILVVSGADKRSIGLAMGVQSAFRQAGLALGPGVAGPVIAVMGYSAGFFTGSIVGLAGIVLILLIGRKY
ncbi:MAG: MFS transporter [Thaumarchaeota archaeon]|nr:MFS transporter [Nitrososphaerota archaeon]